MAVDGTQLPVAPLPAVLSNNEALLEAYGHHIANLIEVDCRTVGDLYNRIASDRSLAHLRALSVQNIAFILTVIEAVFAEADEPQ